MRIQTYVKPQNFYDVYCWQISARLKKIDLFLKTSWRGIGAETAARLLDISAQEVRYIMKDEGIHRIDRSNFYILMRRGSSDICQYVNRETELDFPATYTMEDIAYIYDLNIDDVIRAAEVTGIHEATAFTLPYLFYHIPID